MYGRMQELGSLKSLLLYVPHLSGASTLFSHPELPFLRAHLRECLKSDGCSKADILLPEFPEDSPAHTGGLQLLMTMISVGICLKDDAVKVLHSICQQIWKTQWWIQDWKKPVFIPTLMKDNAKECSNYHTIAVILHSSKVMFKILQARLY